MIKTLTGANNYELRQALSDIKHRFVKQHGDLAIEIIDAEEAELDKITSAIQAQPFLSAKKLVILHKPSTNKAFAEHFERLAQSVPDNTEVVLVELNIDKRLAYYKSLKKLTDFKEFAELSEQHLPKWVQDKAKELGGLISFSDSSYLISRIGTNQQMLANELAKLIAFGPNITRDSINELTEPTPQSTVFELLDSAIRGKSNKAIKIYQEQRWLGEEPLKIMAMIGWQLHILALIKSAGSTQADEIANKTKLHPYIVRKNLPVVAELTMRKIKELLSEAVELDIKLKNQTIDADEAIQNFLLKLSA